MSQLIVCLFTEKEAWHIQTTSTYSAIISLIIQHCSFPAVTKCIWGKTSLYCTSFYILNSAFSRHAVVTLQIRLQTLGACLCTSKCKAISSFCLNDNAAVIMSHIAVMFLLSFASTLTRTHCLGSNLTHFDSDRSKKNQKNPISFF